jgi:hypothetical protein
MNIFVLDVDIPKCARYHCDQHVVKMILESAQMLCTALNTHGIPTPYKATHLKHPCVMWVQKSYANFRWLTQLAFWLNEEYKYRFEKEADHKSWGVIEKIKGHTFTDKGPTPFAQAMPARYRVPGDAVKAYRQYYIAEKLAFAKWTKRRVPFWARQ